MVPICPEYSEKFGGESHSRRINITDSIIEANFFILVELPPDLLPDKVRSLTLKHGLN